MTQFIPILVSFSLIPILPRFRFKLSHTLLICAGTLSLLSRFDFGTLSRIITSIFTELSSRNTILTVMMVSVVGGLMKHFGLLDRIVKIILSIIRNKKHALILVPAMIGILIIPGGALLSAPFVNNLGKEMGITVTRRAAINLAFRHLAMFLLPYSTVILLISATMPYINVFKLLSLNILFVISIIIIGYFFLLKDINSELLPSRTGIIKNLLMLVLYTSPIYIAVIINVITGWPFYITLIASIFIIYLLSFKEGFFRVIVESVNWDTVLTVIGVLLIKEAILNMEGLRDIFDNIFSGSASTASIMGMLMVTAIFFGWITGSNTASLAIILPMLSQINIEGGFIYIYLSFTLGCAFIGYYFSPIHLCQAFTLDYMGITTGELYKEYKYYAPALLLALVVIAFIYLTILKAWTRC